MWIVSTQARLLYRWWLCCCSISCQALIRFYRKAFDRGINLASNIFEKIRPHSPPVLHLVKQTPGSTCTFQTSELFHCGKVVIKIRRVGIQAEKSASKVGRAWKALAKPCSWPATNGPMIWNHCAWCYLNCTLYRLVFRNLKMAKTMARARNRSTTA